MEAEYVALSSCMRVVLPLHELIKHTFDTIQLPSSIATSFSSTVFNFTTTVYEDNQSAYYLATNQRITNRTKHFLIKWHHFWDAVRNGHIKVVKIPTDLQNADYLTKGLPASRSTSSKPLSCPRLVGHH